jgi:hypothetical protein
MIESTTNGLLSLRERVLSQRPALLVRSGSALKYMIASMALPSSGTEQLMKSFSPVSVVAVQSVSIGIVGMIGRLIIPQHTKYAKGQKTVLVTALVNAVGH